jgi:predicted Zn-dependent protease with MMP-like domain
MNSAKRIFFDKQFQKVLEKFPETILNYLEEVAVCVEDRPSPAVLKDAEEENGDDLLGFFCGSMLHSGGEAAADLPPTIYLYREAIWDSVPLNRCGRPKIKDLQEEIRITLLHELGHYLGFEEDDLEEIGYG